MKNVIIIDIDTERNEVIKIFKPDLVLTETVNEAKTIVTKDIACITETLGVLFDTMIDMTDKTYDMLIDECVEQLKLRHNGSGK